MNDSYDVIIAGLGAMGSAAAYHLARRGLRTLGLDRFHPPHTWGSSHGQSRIIRQAYYEHPGYVPLVQRAYTLWAELERQVNETLFRQTGGLMLGPVDGELVGGALESARRHNLRHELLEADKVRSHYPILGVPDHFVAVWEPRAGVLFPERCIAAHLEVAERRGAHLHFDEPVQDWCVEGDSVQVTTTKECYRCKRLLLTAGAWLGRLIPELDLPLVVERQVLYWFEPAANAAMFQPDVCPIYLWEYEPERFFYGFPELGAGVKVAFHHQGELTDPDTVDRTVGAAEQADMRTLLARYMPDVNGRLVDTAVCMYTNTPDRHFVIDFHPAHPHVLIASPCSGHGFKFSSAIGEVLATLLASEAVPFDLSLVRLERLVNMNRSAQRRCVNTLPGSAAP